MWCKIKKKACDILVEENTKLVATYTLKIRWSTIGLQWDEGVRRRRRVKYDFIYFKKNKGVLGMGILLEMEANLCPCPCPYLCLWSEADLHGSAVGIASAYNALSSRLNVSCFSFSFLFFFFFLIGKCLLSFLKCYRSILHY
jgi:hypothetical protein